MCKNPLNIELNWSQFRAKTVVECVELYLESMGIQWGTSLELVWNLLANPMFSFGNVWGMHMGLLGNERGIDQGLLRIIWETVDIRRGCWKMHWEFVGNSYELFGKPLVFIGNPWRICGDFRLGIRSLGEVQIQTEHIHTHAISLTKPRFPFHVLTGSAGPCLIRRVIVEA